MKFIEGGLKNISGFKFSAIKCGIRYENRLDYSLIVSDNLCNASGVFTTNRVFAAPVKLSRERINGKIKAILINATNANACTGQDGYNNAEKLTSDIASRLKEIPSSVLMASTGIIGRQLPVEKMSASHDMLIKNLSAENGSLLANAIMTTDTYPKETCISFKTGRGIFQIAGTAKGSGMIAPDMATLLAFILTDAPVSKADLDKIFKSAIKKTLNSITIDGDMSTNDTAIILSPVSEKYLADDDLNRFAEALEMVLFKLSELLVKDAEGATKFVKIFVKNAANDDDAQKIAKSVAESLLVKTAFFGNDPNWGRIACAAGYSGAELAENRLSIYFSDMKILDNGLPVDFNKDELLKIISGKEISVLLDLSLGKGEAMMMTCDISHDYVKINAEYST
jgi:glutamate N-acetyltransferase/amino-acid N-acetyltransferase